MAKLLHDALPRQAQEARTILGSDSIVDGVGIAVQGMGGRADGSRALRRSVSNTLIQSGAT